MATLFNEATGGREITLAQAIDEQLEWDVFLSHKSNDVDEAVKLAERIRSHGLSAWVDELDPNVTGDYPTLDEYIESVLSRTFSLLALVTDVTHESWWVPFEIGLAFELRRYLSSFVAGGVNLPSFLEKHPRLADYAGLRRWCMMLKQLKAQRQPETIVLAEHDVEAVSRDAYLTTMRGLARDFR